jgi:hypothetical protein
MLTLRHDSDYFKYLYREVVIFHNALLKSYNVKYGTTT